MTEGPSRHPEDRGTASAPAFLATLREALRGGSRVDYTEGDIARSVVLLAVPMVLEMVLESVFAVVNVFWVGRLGADAVATVGLTESLLSLVYALAFGLSMAATATVARRIGEKDPDRAARTAVQAIALGVVISIPISAIGLVFAKRVLGLLGGSPELVANGWRFTAIMLGGNVVIVLLFLINAVFRAAGDAAIAARVLWTGNLLNLILDPLLIFGLGPFPKLGVAGAAVATVTARGAAVLVQLVVLSRGTDRLKIRREHLGLEPRQMLELLRLSGSAVLQNVIGTASWIAIMRILAAFGSAAVAGYTIAIRVVIFAILPSWGLSNAAATLVGQNLGARKPDRAERSVWIAARYNTAFLGGLGLVFLVLAGPVVRLFTDDPAVRTVGIPGLRVLALGFALFALGMTLVQAFNGAGDTRTPMLLNLFCFWLFEIPLAWFLANRAGFAAGGVFWAVFVAFSLYALAAARLFRRGAWKAVRV